MKKHKEPEQNLNWGKGLTIYEKTRKAILEVLSDGKPWRKSSLFHQFWLRGFHTTSSAVTVHLDKLCAEKKIKVVEHGITLMCGDNSVYQITDDKNG